MKIPKHFRIPCEKDKELILSYTRLLGGTLSCEYAFSNLLSWGELYALSFMEKEGRLWVYNGTEDFLYFPLGSGEVKPELLREMSLIFRSQGLRGVLDQIPLAWYHKHESELPDFSFQYKDDFWDYVYSVDKLADLPGETLGKKRNLVKQFEKHYPYWRAEPLNGSDTAWVEPFVRTWAAAANHDGGSVEEDLEALRQVFNLWDAGGFEGLRILTGDDVAAFCVWSCPTDEMAIVHFEKALRFCKGGSQMINCAAARTLRERGKIKWINREQDLGVPGLRQAKRSYEPDYLIEVGILSPRTDEVQRA